MATEVDLSYDQGTTYQFNWTVFTDPSLSIQANLVGYSASMNVCYSYDNQTVLASYATANGNMYIDTANSNVVVNIANTDFIGASFPVQQDAANTAFVYDVKLYNANTGSTVRIAQGDFILNKQVTQ